MHIYTSKGTQEALNLQDSKYNYRVRTLETTVRVGIGNFIILPFNVEHDVNEPLGFLIYHKELGKVVFATDTYYLSNRFKDVDHILIECNYSEDILDNLQSHRARVLKSHMSLETLKSTLKTWDLSSTKDIMLIHVSEGNGEPERFRGEIEEMTGIKTYIATKGLEIR